MHLTVAADPPLDVAPTNGQGVVLAILLDRHEGFDGRRDVAQLTGTSHRLGTALSVVGHVDVEKVRQ